MKTSRNTLSLEGDMLYGFDKNGGFLVQSDNGNCAYAFPTSVNATQAKRLAFEIAARMAANADETAVWCDPNIVAASNARWSAELNALSR